MVLWMRVCDQQHFKLVLDQLPAEHLTQLQHRLGCAPSSSQPLSAAECRCSLLTTFNPMLPEGAYTLRLDRADEAKLAAMLIQLAAAEVGLFLLCCCSLLTSTGSN